MKVVVRVTAGALLLAAAGALAGPVGGPPSQFPGNGNGPPHGWFPGGGGGLGGPGDLPGPGPSGSDTVFVPPIEPAVIPPPMEPAVIPSFVAPTGPAISPSTANTVPEPSTLFLSIAAVVLAGVASRRR